MDPHSCCALLGRGNIEIALQGREEKREVRREKMRGEKSGGRKWEERSRRSHECRGGQARIDGRRNICGKTMKSKDNEGHRYDKGEGTKRKVPSSQVK